MTLFLCILYNSPGGSEPLLRICVHTWVCVCMWISKWNFAYFQEIFLNGFTLATCKFITALAFTVGMFKQNHERRQNCVTTNPCFEIDNNFNLEFHKSGEFFFVGKTHFTLEKHAYESINKYSTVYPRPVLSSKSILSHIPQG